MHITLSQTSYNIANNTTLCNINYMRTARVTERKATLFVLTLIFDLYDL